MMWRASERFVGRMRVSGSPLADDTVSATLDDLYRKDASHIIPHERRFSNSFKHSDING